MTPRGLAAMLDPSPAPDQPEVLARIFGGHELPSATQLGHYVVELRKWQTDHVDRAAQGYYDRLQRGCSWLAKATRVADLGSGSGHANAKKVADPEAAFVFSWIALNALYGVRPEVFKTKWWRSENGARPSQGAQQDDDEEPREIEWFLWRICGLDADHRVLKSVIEDNWDDVAAILHTRYLMSSFWSWRWQTEGDIESLRGSSERMVSAAIGPIVDRQKMYLGVREIIVWRLRVLRNQLFHGCATDIHSKRRAEGRSELEAGWQLLGELVWAFLRLMASEAGHQSYWPPVPFPRANSAQHRPFDSGWVPAASDHGSKSAVPRANVRATRPRR